jgi:hypothetical protein
MREDFEFEKEEFEASVDENKQENSNASGSDFDEGSFKSYERGYYEKEPIRYEEIFDLSRPKSRGFSVASMVFGIISVICCCTGWVGVFCAALAIVFAVVSRKTLRYFDGMSIAGLVLGIFGLVMGVMIIWVTYGPMAEMLDEIYKEIENMPTDDLYEVGF